jgi:hypothetical protein
MFALEAVLPISSQLYISGITCSYAWHGTAIDSVFIDSAACAHTFVRQVPAGRTSHAVKGAWVHTVPDQLFPSSHRTRSGSWSSAMQPLLPRQLLASNIDREVCAMRLETIKFNAPFPMVRKPNVRPHSRDDVKDAVDIFHLVMRPHSVAMVKLPCAPLAECGSHLSLLR